MNSQDGRATSRVRLKSCLHLLFFYESEVQPCAVARKIEPADFGDKQEVVSSLDESGEHHTKSDRGEGGVGPYGVSGSLESSGERHTKSDNGEGSVGTYGVTGVGIDNTGDWLSEC